MDGPGQFSEPGGDDPNLAYAREQTDLVLNRLDEQLARRDVDPELLKSLGWSEAELRQFVDRWKSLKEAAEAPGEGADEARDQLDAALRSLGLRAKGPVRVEGGAAPDELRDLNEGFRGEAPAEYADRVRAYLRGAGEAE